MIYSTLLVAAIVGLASAQNSSSVPGSFTSCCNIVPSSVDLVERLSWCRAQTNTCPETCANGQFKTNACDANALTFDCECLTGTTPNISDYAQTLPSLECDAWVAQCTAAHPNDLSGQTFCQSFICGKKNASASGSSASSPSSSSLSTAAGSSATGSSTTSSTASATASKAAAAAIKAGREYGTGAVAVGMLALFGLAL